MADGESKDGNDQARGTQMKSTLLPPTKKAKIRLTIAHDPRLGKSVTLDPRSNSRIASWEVDVCAYAIVRHNAIQYVGCASRGFSRRFFYGLKRANTRGYRWPTTNGYYQLFVWRVANGKVFAEALESEIAFLNRAVMGDWPIELNQLSIRRHLVQPEAAAYGKIAALGAYRWLMHKNYISTTPQDHTFIRELVWRAVGITATA